MRKIQICSDVTSNYGGNEDCSKLKKYNFQLFNEKEDFIIFEYPKKDLGNLQGQVAFEIEKCLLKKNTIPRRITKIKYKDKEIELDLRDEKDWEIAFLIGLFDMITNAIKLNGSIFIFNKDKFEDNWAGEILAFLRWNRTTVDEIHKGVTNGWKEIGFEKSVSEAEIINTLALLQEYGMVCYSDIDNTYDITARGYLYR